MGEIARYRASSTESRPNIALPCIRSHPRRSAKFARVGDASIDRVLIMRATVLSGAALDTRAGTSLVLRAYSPERCAALCGKQAPLVNRPIE
ncbi:hypothetical protein CH295_02960 [Rhodococcus sp. 14-2483-1-2]|nr:hypothetical protein CH295_02960 [Rhodococcus sp. 14-2483-1-2]